MKHNVYHVEGKHVHESRILSLTVQVGIGLCEGVKMGTNWRLLFRTMLAWAATIFISALLSASLFCFGAFKGGSLGCLSVAIKAGHLLLVSRVL